MIRHWVFAGVLAFGSMVPAAEPDPIAVAQGIRAKAGPVRPVNATTVIAEAEEFQASGAWKARRWGENYYCATFANSFLSRKAFLGAPEQCEESAATIDVDVPAAGRYLALVRYEAAYRFETQFRLRVEQGGKTLLDRAYGSRDNLKIWAFREGLKKEVAWSWGAGENMVWEGHDAAVDLKPGKARLTLLAGKQIGDAARRNIDLVMLTNNAADVEKRIKSENYLPLDGMLTQAGDLYLRLQVAAGSAPFTLQVPNGTEHSPYWVHQRTWKPMTITAIPGKASDWVEVGGMLDSLCDGQWTLSPSAKAKEPALDFTLEFAIPGGEGKFETVATFAKQTGPVALAYDADTRYTRRIRLQSQILPDLLTELKKDALPGAPPKRTLILGYAFGPEPRADEFRGLFGMQSGRRGSEVYIDVRGVPTPKLEEHCLKLKAEGKADAVKVVSLGDEIGLAMPGANDHASFRTWCQARGLTPAEFGKANWDAVQYSPDLKKAAENPAAYYHSRLFAHEFGLKQLKERTEILSKHLPNAGVGANYSPHHHHMYLGDVNQWVKVFREGAMTQPWGEDYIWQVPVGTAQMNFINLDLFRAGARHQPKAKIHYYVMPHTPGNTPEAWRRQFYGDLGHGMKIVNLFEFHPVQVAYTENHCSDPAMFREIRRSFHELAAFEDIVQDGQIIPGSVGLLFGSTADIWDDYAGPFGAAKRALYVALLHQQRPVDFLIEDYLDEKDLQHCKVLFVTDRHLSRKATEVLVKWVEKGGRLFLTAGAGLRDEYDRPNEAMIRMLAIAPGELEAPPGDSVRLIKQDLPFSKPLDSVAMLTSNERPMPVIAARDKFAENANNVHRLAQFSDKSPAVVSREVKSGQVVYCGFLPGLSYFQPAIPKRPVDRGSTNDSFAHFIPTEFHPQAHDLIGMLLNNVQRPVVCSHPLVEASVIQSRTGLAVILTNWSGKPIRDLRVALHIPAPSGVPRLASGRPMKTGAGSGPRAFTLDLDVADALILK